MKIEPDSTESKIVADLYKTAYSPDDEKFIGITGHIITPKGDLLVCGRFANDNHTYFFDYTELTSFCL